MYRAIISDFDGTIVDHNLVLSPSVVAKVVDFQKYGFIFTIASGRGFLGDLADAVAKMKILSPIIIRNGAEIVLPESKKVIYGKYIKPQVSSKIIQDLIKEEYEFYVEKADYTYSVEAKPGIHAPNENYKDIKLLEASDIPKILIKADSLTKADKIKNYLISNFNEQISVKVNSLKDNIYAIDVNSIEVSKATAIEFLIDYMNLDKYEIVAIGDNMNDISLFEHAGYKIAMGNAVDELKSIADFVTDSVDEQGIIKVIDMIIDGII
ncbi:Cof-type HAD-IIB family hydrolase [Candidatus Dojkabacteria bacterium]|uniref:Cof-type HAD-IIB family hydrolase n=1 Tax=Candidatus Dojkabacteria bacterium TaxID=2099670 RepID=A0A955L0Z7_9BACT|nr:Cof-type HAD-IIB family hydrolase [Candidatus Dojkabacteria bacterium]